jgi:CsoR family transcriptional regulator, copper-sensing transcriptional repressor
MSVVNILYSSMFGKDKIKTNEKQMVDALHRVRGQIEGIERMMGNNKDCLEVIQQVVAARSALLSIGTKILAKESCKCEVKKDKKRFEKIVKKLLEFK